MRHYDHSLILKEPEMMTFIAFAAVALAAYLAGALTMVACAAWYEANVEEPLRKRQAERDDLMAVSHAMND